MKRFSDGERDYAFGQAMLTLRTSIGLTQAGLADLLEVSRRAVGEWEAGSSYPKAHHLKAFLALCVRQQVFPPEREEEEIRALWKAAHQKVLLDEAWLAALLNQPSPPPAPLPVEETDRPEEGSAPTPSPTGWALAPQPGRSPLSGEPIGSRAPADSGPQVDWGDALEVPSFYGRQGELATLAQWMVQQRCRVVSVLGLGGIGKSALVTSAMRQLASHFQVVLFRSLRDAPDCSALLEECLQRLAPQPLGVGAADLERHLSLLLSELREQRVLLVLDNLESVLEEGEARGHLRPGYESYARLLQGVAERAHQSCLLLTSREKPAVLRALEGRHTPVRSLRLGGLEAAVCEQLLASHALFGSPQERARLVERYGGNPLALNIVAETIAELFGGEIAQFLAQDTLVFGGISDLLDEQIGRLSALEQTILSWLAIAREPLTLEELRALLVARLAPVQVLEAVDGLRRRSLIEQGQRAGSFTLQSVVLEYVTAHLVEQLVGEIVQGRLSLLIQHPLSQAQAKDYVRQTQERLLVAPLLARLESVYQGRAELEQRLRSLLEQVRSWVEDRQGYGPANLVTLLRVLRGHLRGLDLSRLVLRGVHLQGVELQDANLAGALMQESVFTETFDAITAVAISPSGQYWAAASKRGEVRVWKWGQEANLILHLVWRAHTDMVLSIAFSPDGHTLVSGSWDYTVKLWDVTSGALLWTGWHTESSNSVAFAPDGKVLTSGGSDAAVRLWDPLSGKQFESLSHPAGVFALNWSPDGRLLISGDSEGTIRLWQVHQTGPSICVQTLSGHTNMVRGLAFAPDSSVLASASWDGSVKLWDVGEEGSLRVRQTLVGHTDRVQTLAWSPDGGTLASGSGDHTIRLWDVEQGNSRMVLQGNTAMVYSLAFTPDGRHLLSGSDDGTLRLWEVASGQSLRVLQGYAAALFDLDWSPDGTQVVSGGTETLLTIWDVTGREGGTPPRVLRGHGTVVYGVGWSPDGSKLATNSEWDSAIRLWDTTSGACVEVLRDPDYVDTVFYGVAWSPDGHLLASGTFLQGVLVWDVTAGSLRWVNRAHPTWIHHVAWSPDGRQLVGGGDDGHIYLWDAADGRLLLRLAEHHAAVLSVTFSPDGSRLASAGGSEVLVWDVHSGERVRALAPHSDVATAVAWDPSAEQLVSGSSDGMLRWWDVDSGACMRVQEAHQGTVQALKVSPDGSSLASCGGDGAIILWDLESGEPLRTLRRDRPYERLTITGIRGLTEAQKTSLRALGAIEDEASTSGEQERALNGV